MILLLWFHIAGGAAALASGFSAAAVRKGGTGHRRTGTVFAVSMLIMCATGLVLSFGDGQMVNILAASLTAYLVATGWTTVRPLPGPWRRRALPALAVFGAAVAMLAAFSIVHELLRAPSGSGPSTPGLVIRLVFGTVAALAVVGDVSALRGNGPTGAHRLARHLWRMLLALAIAALSFFIGQADEIPEWLRGPHLAAPPPACAGTDAGLVHQGAIAVGRIAVSPGGIPDGDGRFREAMMTVDCEDRSAHAYARWAGFFYVFSMAVYVAQDSILAGFTVRGDFAATARNIAEGELLYRIGLALRVLGTLTLIGLGWFFYGLLRPVVPVVATVLLVWRGVQAGIDAMGVTFRYARLEEYLADPATAVSLAGQMLGAAHRDSFQIQFVYLGAGSALLFWALLKSGHIPRPLALFSLAASILLIGQAFLHLIVPDFVRSLGIGMMEYIPIFIAEIGTGLWLWVVGARKTRNGGEG